MGVDREMSPFAAVGSWCEVSFSDGEWLRLSILSKEAKDSVNQTPLAAAVRLAGLPTCRSRSVC